MRSLDRSRVGLLSARNLRIAAVVLLSGWTLFWAIQALQGLAADSALGRSGIQGIPAFHQVWEVVFVSAYYFLRWAAGAAVLALPLVAGPAARLWSRIRSPREAFSES
ncbi:MAG TPA: hypothetical protein VLA43_06655 [Longimicrobiales bacterium]|nr:hypothetical protein [Longimicrobiales bacterium]